LTSNAPFGTVAFSFLISPHRHGQDFSGDPQHPLFEADSSEAVFGGEQHDLQQDFSGSTALDLTAFSGSTTNLGKNRETLRLQSHPSHQQNETGVTTLNNIATMTAQATNCRNEKGLI
jgi:hypothetical protein